MTKVAVVGEFRQGALEAFFAQGLERAGADVNRVYLPARPYSRVTRHLSGALVKAGHRRAARTLDRSVDLVLAVKAPFWGRDEIEVVRRVASEAIVALYLPDDPVEAHRARHFGRKALDGLASWDAVLTWTETQRPLLESVGARRVEVVPFGWADEHRRPPRKPGSEPYVAAFVGGWDHERGAAMTQISNARRDDRFFVAGSGWHRAHLPPNVVVVPHNLYSDALVDALAAARFAINLPRQQNVANSNMRLYELPAGGFVQVCPHPMRAEEGSVDVVRDLDDAFASLSGDATLLAERERQWAAVSSCSYADRMVDALKILAA
jgi:SpoU rRNA methylase family enzyme